MKKICALALPGILLLAACDFAPPPTTQAPAATLAPLPLVTVGPPPAFLLTLQAPAAATPRAVPSPLAATTPLPLFTPDLVERLLYWLPEQESTFLPQGFDWDRSAAGRVTENRLDLGLKPSGLTTVYWQTVIGANAPGLFQLEYQVVITDSQASIGPAIAGLTAEDAKQIDNVKPITSGLAPGASGLTGSVTSNSGTSDIITIYSPVGNSNIFAYIIGLADQGTLKVADVAPYAGSLSNYLAQPLVLTATLPSQDPALLLQPEQLPSGYDFGPSGPMRPAVFFGTAQDAGRIAPGATAAWVNTFVANTITQTLGFVESSVIVFDSAANAASAANAMVAESQKGMQDAKVSAAPSIRPGLQIVTGSAAPAAQYLLYDYIVPTGNTVQEISFVWEPGTPDVDSQSTELFKKIAVPK